MTLSPKSDDTALFHALRQGEPAALDGLFRRHYVGLCRAAAGLVTDPTAAEDIVQETFAGLWTRRAALPDRLDSVGAYLRRSVRNRSLNYLRDRKRLPLTDQVPPDTPSAADLPGSAMEEAEQRQRITAAIDRLPERCRLVFVMCKVEELPQRQVAEELGISVKTVENQMTRAYAYLRQWLTALILYLLPNVL